MFNVTLETLLLYLPVLAFLGGLWIYRSKAEKFEFDVAAGIAIFAIAAKIAVQFFVDRGGFLSSIGLIVAGLLLFAILVFSVGDRISGETTLSISAGLALAPWFSGIIAFALAIIVLIIKLSIATMKTMNMDSKTLALDVAMQTGFGSGALPSLKNMETITEGQKTTVVPVFFFVYLAISIIATVGSF